MIPQWCSSGTCITNCQTEFYRNKLMSILSTERRLTRRLRYFLIFSSSLDSLKIKEIHVTSSAKNHHHDSDEVWTHKTKSGPYFPVIKSLLADHKMPTLMWHCSYKTMLLNSPSKLKVLRIETMQYLCYWRGTYFQWFLLNKNQLCLPDWLPENYDWVRNKSNHADTKEYELIKPLDLSVNLEKCK